MNLDDAFDDGIEIKRDRWGRYLLPDPVTGEERSWQRVTTFVKILADTYNLERWRMRKAGRGLAMRPDLVALVAGVSDPDSRDGKRTIEEAVDAAIETAGGSAAANIGTAIHALTDTLDRGDTPAPPTPEIAERLDTYAAAMKAHGLEPVPEWIERVIVNTALEVGGTADRFVCCADGKVRVADLKTGTSVDFGQLEYAMQLAAYANADGLYNGHGYDPMPDELDTSIGYIIHLPAAGGDCVIHEVDLTYGLEAARLAVEVRAARRRKGLLRALAAGPCPADPDRRLEVLRRCRRLDVERRESMKAQWPEGVPGLAGDHRHTDAELDAIESVLDLIDGSRVDDDAHAELVERMKHLPGDLFLAAEATAKAEGIPHVERGWSEAHAARLSALIEAAELDAHERHMQRVKALAEFDEAHLANIATLTGVGRDDIGRLTLDDLAHERVMAAVDLLESFNTLQPAHAEIIDRLGGKRQLISAASAAAKRHGIDCPRAADDIAADPLLSALALHTNTESTTQHS